MNESIIEIPHFQRSTNPLLLDDEDDEHSLNPLLPDELPSIGNEIIRNQEEYEMNQQWQRYEQWEEQHWENGQSRIELLFANIVCLQQNIPMVETPIWKTEKSSPFNEYF